VLEREGRVTTTTRVTRKGTTLKLDSAIEVGISRDTGTSDGNTLVRRELDQRGRFNGSHTGIDNGLPGVALNVYEPWRDNRRQNPKQDNHDNELD
jgi:hypothetical protein